MNNTELNNKNYIEQLMGDDLSSVALQPSSLNNKKMQKGNNSEINPVWLKDLTLEDSSVDWLLEGFLALKHFTLLSSNPKSGKTTLINHFLSSTDEFLGFEKIQFKTLVISEESNGIWFFRKKTLNLPAEDVAILSRPFFTKPKNDEWINRIKKITEYCIAHNIKLVIFDTISQFWPVKKENDASQVMDALQPLYQLTKAGLSVLLIHHNRKSGGDDGLGVRGSSSFMGFVDIALSLSKESGGGNRRIIASTSRFDETPDKISIEIVGDKYISLGETKFVKWQDRLKSVLKLIPTAPKGITIQEIKSEFDKDGDEVNKATVFRWIQRANKEGFVISVGKSSKKGKPDLWAKPKQDNSTQLGIEYTKTKNVEEMEINKIMEVLT